MRNIFLIFSVFSISLTALADRLSIPRPDGTQITFYLDTPKINDFPLLIYFHGSTCTTSFPTHEYLKSKLLSSNIGVLTLEKRGLSKTSSACPYEYIQNNTIQDRVLDHLQVVAYLRKNIHQWNRKTGLAGGSEGGTIAAIVASLVPETTAVVLLASGGGLSMGEEMLLLTKKQMQEHGATDQDIQSSLSQMRQLFVEIKSNPTPNKEWLSDGNFARNTYKWWAAVLDVKIESSLLSLSTPIYMAHGTADTSVPVESADLLANSFINSHKTNLKYKRYDDLDHKWQDKQGNQHPEVINDAFVWIIIKLSSRSSK